MRVLVVQACRVRCRLAVLGASARSDLSNSRIILILDLS